MTAHDWFIEQRTGYVTRMLERTDETRFREHLAGCADCRTAVAELERELAWLPMGASPVPLRPGLARSFYDRVIEPPHRRWMRRAAPWAMAASVALAVAGWTVGRSGQTRLAAELTGRDRTLAAVQDTLSVLRGASRVAQAGIAMNGVSGGMMVIADMETHRWNVVIHGLPPAPPGQRYQFWFVADDGMVQGAELEMHGSRPVFFMTGMPPGDHNVTGAALTLTRVGAPAPEEGRMLAKVSL